MNKRKSFSFENEIRAIKIKYEGIKKQPYEMPKGIEIDWQIEKVVEQIFIDPYADEWFADVVKSVINKYIPELSNKVKWSNMKSDPQY